MNAGKGGSVVVPIKWKIAVFILLLVSIGLLIAVIVVAVEFAQYKEKYPSNPEANTCADGILNDGEPPKSQGIFNDLSRKEVIAARDFMQKQSSLKLKSIENASVKDNYIYMIQFHPPEKDAVLGFLEKGKSKPARKALVVVFHGEDDPPVVREYIVSWPNNTEDMTYAEHGNPLTFNVRPYDQVQHKVIEKIVLEATSKAFQILNESYDGYCYHNCTNKLLKFHPQGPFGKTPDDRTTWLQFTRDLEGESLNPVDFQLYITFPGSDASKWKVNKVYYNGLAFNTIDDLVYQYNQHAVISKSFIPAPLQTPLFSSYEHRGIPQSQKPRRAPKMFEPDGKRFSVSGRHVKYMGWSFDFRMDSVSGPQLFDIRFKDRRIIYELSLQEAISFYSGYSPYFMAADFVYGGWTMGAKTYELVGGVDCPETSTFFDVEHFVDTNHPEVIKNAVCVFEMDSGIPLRRHFETDAKGRYRFYEGLTNHVLVLRTITTIRNYDNIFDFVFYQSGAIEVKSTPTGYIQTDNDRLGLDNSFGEEIQSKLLGNLHDHIFHYKVDLDVHDKFNSFEKIEIIKQDILNEWHPPDRVNLKVFQRQEIRRETDTEFKKIDFDKPTFYNVYSNNQNKFGSKRGYLIEPQSAVKQVLPEGDKVTMMAPWSVYPLVITKYRETELKSSSLYNQNSPSKPIVNFLDFFQKDNDAITNEDLVAWVSIGCIEIPSSEDIPNVASAANTARFFLRPFNYFDAGPSANSTNAVFIKPANDKTSSSPNVVKSFVTAEEVCVPVKYDINLKGSYE